jgi:hypothetical protein
MWKARALALEELLKRPDVLLPRPFSGGCSLEAGRRCAHASSGFIYCGLIHGVAHL